MNKKLYKDESPEKRKEYLKNGADKIESLSYIKKFTSEEIREFKDNLSDLSIKKDGIDTDFDVVKQSFKEQLKPIKKEIKTTLTYLRDKARSVTEDCYVVYNYDNNSTEFYNGEGEMVYSRPMETSELQKTIFSIDKTGTTD
jgi:hypothetical protein